VVSGSKLNLVCAKRGQKWKFSGLYKIINKTKIKIKKKSHIIVKPIDSLLGSQSEEFMKIYLPYSQ